MTRAYNSARCSPTRASLFTGLYPHQAGVGYFAGPSSNQPGYQGHLLDRCVGISEVLKGAGYNTYMAGKWHMGSSPGPIERGFDEFYGFVEGSHIDCWDPEIMIRLPEGKKTKQYANGEFYATDAITDYAMEFLSEGSESSDPFFLFLSYNAPHYPLQAPKDITDKYYPVYLEGWDTIRSRRFHRIMELGIGEPGWELPPRSEVMIEMRGRDMGYGGEPNPAWNDFPEDRRRDLARRMAVYAAMIDNMDMNIGRIISLLEESGELDNTLIFFLSDNGANAEVNPIGFDQFEPKINILNKGDQLERMGLAGSFIGYGTAWAMACNTPLNLYKHYTHEGGISTPFIIHWPEMIKRSGSINKQPAHIVDVMATCVDVSGAEYPKKNKGTDVIPMEGKSLLPVIQGEEMAPRTFGFEHERNRGYLKGKWKLVSAHYRGNRWELYNIEEDRLEQNNLASEYPEIVEELAIEYEAWARRVFVLPEREMSFQYLKEYQYPLE
jgi:arylsulfatase